MLLCIRHPRTDSTLLALHRRCLFCVPMLTVSIFLYALFSRPQNPSSYNTDTISASKWDYQHQDNLWHALCTSPRRFQELQVFQDSENLSHRRPHSIDANVTLRTPTLNLTSKEALQRNQQQTMQIESTPVTLFDWQSCQWQGVGVSHL